jgi:hypothetical protein
MEDEYIEDDNKVCPVCKMPFTDGETLRFIKYNGKRILYHPICFPCKDYGIYIWARKGGDNGNNIIKRNTILW